LSPETMTQDKLIELLEVTEWNWPKETIS
jgi:hypothetical protein